MNLGTVIKQFRKQQGLSQAELASLSGTTQASLSQIEAGRRPKTETLKNISESLKVPEALLYISGLEKEDVPEQNRELYDQLFPLIESMITSLVAVKK